MSIHSSLSQLGPKLAVQKAKAIPQQEFRVGAAKTRASKAAPMLATHGGRGLAALGLLVALCMGAMAVAQRTHTPVLPAPERAVRAFVAAPGLVESVGGLRELAFEVPGRIKTVRVEEGERVRKGQVLAELDGDDAHARYSAAKADMGVAEAELSVLEGTLNAAETKTLREVDRLRAGFERLQVGPRAEELDRARSEAKAAEIEWKRRVEDAKKYEKFPSVSSQQDRDMTQGLAEITHAQYLAADAKLRELQTGTRKEDLAQAEAQLKTAESESACVAATREGRLNAARKKVEQARAKILQADAELRKTVLESPIDGVVVWKFRHPGETVGVLPPERIVTVADVSALHVRADVDEADFAKIHSGQRVRVTAEAFGTQVFVGRVERVSDSAGQKRFSTGEAKERHDVKVVETLVTFENSPPFKLGLRVTAAFEFDDGSIKNGP